MGNKKREKNGIKKLKSRSKRKYVRNKEKRKENKDGSMSRELQKKNGVI